MNSALDDCRVLQTCLVKEISAKEALQEFERERLKDVNALSDIAYSVALPDFKTSFQLIFLSTFKRFLSSPTKEDLM